MALTARLQLIAHPPARRGPRAAVTYRVRTAIKRLGGVHPDLGRHLENSVRTGTWCAYRPETDVTWDVG